MGHVSIFLVHTAVTVIKEQQGFTVRRTLMSAKSTPASVTGRKNKVSVSMRTQVSNLVNDTKDFSAIVQMDSKVF